jgi:hypothetical protein
MSIFFEVEVKVTAKLLVEMNDGETAEMARNVAIKESNFVGDVKAWDVTEVSGIDLTQARDCCDDTIDL